MPYQSDRTGAQIDATLDQADTDSTKLSGIESGATADQSDAEIKTAYEANSDTNAFTDSEQTKLTGIETSATADQSDAEIKTAYENNADTNEFSDAEQTKVAASYDPSNIAEAVIGINAQTGTSYTFALTDASDLTTMSNASANTLTIPPNSSVAFPIGTVLPAAQIGAGETSWVAGAGVTINKEVGLVFNAQWASAAALQTAADVWLLSGSLKA